ncbi:BatD family protein [Paracoccus lichenicola]|nr:BatD family protein [Paracoccus lichenicola]
MVMRAFLAWLMLASVALAQGDTRLMILHDHGNPVVSEMVELTIRGEYDLTVSLEDMEFPNSPDYDWIQVARDDWHKERVNGRLLQIFERKVALFPRREGALTVGPIDHKLTFVQDNGQRAETTVTAAPITLGVKPFPTDAPPLSASQLTLTDELSADPGRLQKNEILTRRVTVEALGALAHHLPVRPDLSEPWLILFSQPEHRETVLTEAGPVARVVWEWQLRPRTGEPAILHAEAFSWFDTDSRQIEVAPLKPIPFGFAGFGSNFGASDQGTWRGWPLAVLALGGGIAASLGLMLQGRGLLPAAAIRARIRRLLPGPHARAMRRAAAEGDLPALRDAVDRHLRWRDQRPPALLADLDRQLYAPDPPPGFDAPRWLAAFRRTLRQA